MGFLFRRRPRLPATAKGDRVYAIGDVHGRLDLLTELLDRVSAHQRGASGKRCHLVLVGDLVDRGPDSAPVVEHVYNLQKTTGNVVVLQGNHEDMMMAVYGGDGRVLRPWIRSGGDETLRSYGLAVPEADADPADTIAAMRERIPAHLMEWMGRLPLSARSGDYFFCHAGIRPGVPLARQGRNDLLWIREGFLDDATDHGVVVVHGHSITASVDWADNRIGIDTGAYRTGTLTALVLDGEDREIITAGM
ncbi:serine/threonine protein phosphatase [Novosphingobium sp. EMRT-2]|mgnify:CR=1 FL=1|nr:MAG: hypothetical protein ABT11_15650 [Novosphingobium sp. SCN 66-18]QCI95292.1 serine/threonine protein phosphatase [Novosphingobium sp. EMRT-2]RQW44009.1 serine/threonine protein phosphatase [Novosphingobium sp. LASN5T]